MENEKIQCACGCGTWIDRWVDYGGKGYPSQIRERRYVHGHNKPWQGKHLYPEMREAIRKHQTGRKQSEAIKEKRRKTWDAKRGGPKREVIPRKAYVPRICAVCGKELSHSNESGYCQEHSQENKRENHYNWKGGITPLNEIARKSNRHKKWRAAVFERDDYTCQNCNVRGGRLHAHHIKPFAEYHDLRFDVDNGVTLCRKCHRAIHRKEKK